MHITKSEIKFLRSLSQKKVRDREKKFIVEGWKVLKDALNSDFRINFIAISHRYAGDPEYRSFIDDIESRSLELKEMTDIELKQVTDTVHAQGVVALVDQRARTFDEILALHPTLLIVADRIADPGNLGTMIRTCDWFGADALILSEGCVEVYNEKVVRSTSGSIFHIPIVENVDVKSMLTRLKTSGFRCITTSAGARTSYAETEYGEKNVLILGNEASGIHPETKRLADVEISIPRKGKAESLNVGVACGILLSHLRNSR